MRKNKVFYSCGVIISILVIVLVLMFLVMQRKSDKNINSIANIANEKSEDEAQIVSVAEDKSVDETVKEDFSEVPEKTKEQVEDKSTIEKTVEKKTEVNVQPVFAMPVDGEIIRDYAKDKLVYSDTLKEWVTHLGIDIKAKKTSVVKSSSAGKVIAIKNDPRFGLSVVVEHTGGYSTVYSNLLTAEFVTVGEKVDKGETLGTVGNTAAFEILDEPHLHFEIMKDGVQIDPNMYL